MEMIALDTLDSSIVTAMGSLVVTLWRQGIRLRRNLNPQSWSGRPGNITSRQGFSLPEADIPS